MIRMELQLNREVYEQFVRQAGRPGTPLPTPLFSQPLTLELSEPAQPQPKEENSPARSATPLPYRLDLQELTRRMEYDARRRCQTIDNDRELLI